MSTENKVSDKIILRRVHQKLLSAKKKKEKLLIELQKVQLQINKCERVITLYPQNLIIK